MKIREVYNTLIKKVRLDTEKPSNQINILERKISLLSNLLLEWKSYETVLNLSFKELKELQQLRHDANINAEENRRHSHQTLRTKGESIPHEIPKNEINHNMFNNSDTNVTTNIETEVEEVEQGDIMSLFDNEEAEKFEIEFEELRKRTASLFGNKDVKEDKSLGHVEISSSFIDRMIPDLLANDHRIYSLDHMEGVLDSAKLDDPSGESKLITEILHDHLNKLEGENLTTRQKNKLNQIRRVVSKISEIKIYNPKLLEKLIHTMN